MNPWVLFLESLASAALPFLPPDYAKLMALGLALKNAYGEADARIDALTARLQAKQAGQSFAPGEVDAILAGIDADTQELADLKATIGGAP